jgi:hypothetical protein
MTIVRGAPWGENGPLPGDGIVVADVAAASAAVDAARHAGRALPPIGFVGGDVCRTLGGRGDPARLHTPDATRATIDLLAVQLDDGPERAAVAHVVARGRTWLRGPLVLAMNAAWLGRWNVAPRAHPNDGLVDVVRADPSTGDRLKARRRLPLGTHVPHPAIRIERTAATVIELGRSTGVWIDGRRAGTARRLTLRVQPDALRVTV